MSSGPQCLDIHMSLELSRWQHAGIQATKQPVAIARDTVVGPIAQRTRYEQQNRGPSPPRQPPQDRDRTLRLEEC